MASDSGNRLVNPCVFHFQKLGLELKCPLCLSLFNRPTLFPCDHLFCSSCVPRSTELGSECPICNKPYTVQDLRPAPYMENMVVIYRSLDVSFSNMFQPATSDASRVLEQCSVPVNISSGSMLSKDKEPFQSAQGDNSSNGQPIISLTANKRVHVCSSNLLEDVGGKSEKTDMKNVPRNGKEHGSADSRGIELNGKGSVTLPPPVSQFRAVRSMDCGAALMESSPGCPPFYDDTKGSDDSSSSQGTEHNQEISPRKRPTDENLDDKAERLSPGTQDHERNLKRQKKSNAEPVVPSATQDPLVSEPLVTISDTICGFCQSSIVSEDTGEMLHYVCGNPVVGQKASNPNAVHVHSACIEWAPQVYYVGESVKNLDKEMARGAKLKCFKCGLKGAALGCYAKCCRRTYHVPCALKDDCRWETENFLILCPAHSHMKFPFEKKLKSRNQVCEIQPMPTPQLTSQPSNLVGVHEETKNWVLCGSALSSAEKLLLLEFARTFGITVSKFWRPDVTHVIAATNADGACTRTLKILSAILNGRWVLNIDWVKACLEGNRPVDEEAYEVNLDNHGCCDGPKTGRLRALSKEPKLFDGLKFYFSGDFVEGYKRDLQNLVSRGGGVALNSKEDLVAYTRDDQGAPSSILIVYNIDPPPGCKLGEEVSIIWERLNDAEDLAAKIGSRVIGHMWILESIASCTLQPVS